MTKRYIFLVKLNKSTKIDTFADKPPIPQVSNVIVLVFRMFCLIHNFHKNTEETFKSWSYKLWINA